jgi:hypothetical protein
MVSSSAKLNLFVQALPERSFSLIADIDKRLNISYISEV